MPPNGVDLESDSAPPFLNHVLRPHHLALLTIILVAYRREPVHYSPSYLLHIHRVLVREIAEIEVPKPYNELVHELTTAYSLTSPETLSFARSIEKIPKDLNTDSLHEFFSDVIAMVVEKDEDTTLTNGSAIFERRSFFGLFCRRCYISYAKLSFAGLDRLRQDFVSWTNGIDQTAGYRIQETNRKGNGQLLFPTAADEKDYGSASSFKTFESASVEGDLSQAVHHLRLFFDQGLRQHALLNLAHLHYSNREHAAARKYLFEAISVARTSSDKLTLQHCMSLLRRFTPHEGSVTLPLTEIEINTSASAVLFDVIKLVLQTKEPIISSFSRILRALSCYDSATDAKSIPPPEHEQWNTHAVQSFLWKLAGPGSLSRPEENIVLSFTKSGCDNEARWDALRTQAERHSRQGRRDEALVLLLDPDCWHGLNIRQYGEWAGVVWGVLVTPVIRKGQFRHFHEFLRDHMPGARLESYDLWPKVPRQAHRQFSPLLDRDQIQHAKYHYKTRNPLAAINPLLRALFTAEFRGHWPTYRLGVVLLADVALDLGMKNYGRRILEEIMPQIITGDDIELRAFACYVLARCIVASSNGEVDSIRDAVQYLLTSENDYGTLQMLGCQQDVLYFLATVYNTLGMTNERNDAARKHATCVEVSGRWSKEDLPEEVREIWSIVAEVGSIVGEKHVDP